jgi:hypothetical protein
VSSNYHLICLGHDPALVIGSEFGHDEITRLTSRDHEALDTHQHCDIMAGRWSGALVEVGCYGITLGDRRGCKGYHRGVTWTDKDWLHLLHAATTPPNRVDDDTLRSFTSQCWPLDRLRRLRYHLGLPLDDDAAPANTR